MVYMTDDDYNASTQEYGYSLEPFQADLRGKYYF